MSKRTDARRLAVGLAFVAPNIVGFAVFMLFPLVWSLLMAFTNWDIRLHNIFTQESLRFVGLENFGRLLGEPDFFKYLGNTLFFMMGIPLGIAGSLGCAVLLSQDLRGGSRRVWALVAATAGLVAGVGAMVLAGIGATAMMLLVGGLAGVILIGGAAGGRSVYRTLFYFPHFTAGVATFLLWKKLYNPQTGPVNNALRPLLDGLAFGVARLPTRVVPALEVCCYAGVVCFAFLGLRRLRTLWREGEAGALATAMAVVLLSLPLSLMPAWALRQGAGEAVAAVGAGLLAWLLVGVRRPPEFPCAADTGIGYGLITCSVLMIAQFSALGLANVLFRLPAMAAAGLNPPEWLQQYHWAKPALMIMGLWAAMGSNNMLLYLAGLSNIPPELHEAADIDGASRVQRFRHVTWPQLAPVTFFIVVMSVIQGLQGGFEMAKTMTAGGPDGSTTTLSYYVYLEGFETGRLGYASAVAWSLLLLVFAVTLFNWKFGNRYVND